MSELTVAVLDSLVEDLMKARREAEEQQIILTEKNKKVMELEGKAAAHLKETGREDYRTPHGTIYIINRWRVKLPENDLEKQKLFEHLTERGIFMKYATVNSNSLNSLYIKDWEAAKERGEAMTFSMPGIGAPALHESLGFRKK